MWGFLSGILTPLCGVFDTTFLMFETTFLMFDKKIIFGEGGVSLTPQKRALDLRLLSASKVEKCGGPKKRASLFLGGFGTFEIFSSSRTAWLRFRFCLS